MRLDKFLKVSRIIKRRTVANEACDAGKIVVNGKIAKASYNLKLDDIIEIKFKNQVMKIKVVSLSESVRKEDSLSMYQIL
jgi:Ribosome-associated heat shock protein implicated in the recycling of the 50S subunit (S4 paralog)